MDAIGWPELEQLYERFAPSVYRRARQMLGREADAWDAVQEVFRALLESSSTFRGAARPMTYVYRVTTNVCLNQLRARVLRERADAGPPRPIEDGGGSADGLAEAREFLEQLARRVAPRALQVAALYHLDGLSQEEIAEVLQVSRKTVNRDLQALREAAEALKGEHEPQEANEKEKVRG